MNLIEKRTIFSLIFVFLELLFQGEYFLVFQPVIIAVRRAEKETSRRIGRFRSLPYIIIYSEGKANMPA